MFTVDMQYQFWNCLLHSAALILSNQPKTTYAMGFGFWPFLLLMPSKNRRGISSDLPPYYMYTKTRGRQWSCMEYTHRQAMIHYCQQLECRPLHAAVYCSGGLDFQFRDYFYLVTRCIVHFRLVACAWRSYTMSLAHIIRPKSQHGGVDTQAAGSMVIILYQHYHDYPISY